MHLMSARSEQSPLPVEFLSIIRNALRTAALAPSDAAALDVSSAASLSIAALVVEDGQQHG